MLYAGAGAWSAEGVLHVSDDALLAAAEPALPARRLQDQWHWPVVARHASVTESTCAWSCSVDIAGSNAGTPALPLWAVPTLAVPMHLSV